MQFDGHGCSLGILSYLQALHRCSDSRCVGHGAPYLLYSVPSTGKYSFMISGGGGGGGVRKGVFVVVRSRRYYCLSRSIVNILPQSIRVEYLKVFFLRHGLFVPRYVGALYCLGYLEMSADQEKDAYKMHCVEDCMCVLLGYRWFSWIGNCKGVGKTTEA